MTPSTLDEASVRHVPSCVRAGVSSNVEDRRVAERRAGRELTLLSVEAGREEDRRRLERRFQNALGSGRR